MTISRRGLLTCFAAALAAPAIVKVESLMKLAPTKIIRAPSISMREISEYTILDANPVSRLDVLYGKLHIRPEWAFTLDEYSERILAPMVNRLAEQVAGSVMHGSDAMLYGLQAQKTSWTREIVPIVKPIALSDLLVEACRATHSTG